MPGLSIERFRMSAINFTSFEFQRHVTVCLVTCRNLRESYEQCYSEFRKFQVFV